MHLEPQQNNEDVAYVLPNDYTELDRLHQQHWMFKYILKRNFHAPVEDSLKKGIRVLDSGCGPGAWTLDMAETYKNSEFYGIDASSVFPEGTKPENVEFVIANIAKNVPFEDNYFDYIYERLLVLGFRDEDWSSALQELYRTLKPGGFIELVEVNMTSATNMGPLTTELNTKLIEMATSARLIPNVAEQLNDRLAKAGFTDITLKKQDMNFNHTDKGGELMWHDYKAGCFNLRPVVASMHPEWNDLEFFSKHMDACAEECTANKTSGYTIHVYVARKPDN